MADPLMTITCKGSGVFGLVVQSGGTAGHFWIKSHTGLTSQTNPSLHPFAGDGWTSVSAQTRCEAAGSVPLADITGVDPTHTLDLALWFFPDAPATPASEPPCSSSSGSSSGSSGTSVPSSSSSTSAPPSSSATSSASGQSGSSQSSR